MRILFEKHKTCEEFMRDYGLDVTTFTPQVHCNLLFKHDKIIETTTDNTYHQTLFMHAYQ